MFAQLDEPFTCHTLVNALVASCLSIISMTKARCLCAYITDLGS